ncbi:MAG: hypothetical protein WEA61_07380 [Anaerolineales bacterium]
MTVTELFNTLESKQATGADVVDQTLGRPKVIMTLVEGLFAWDLRVAYECAGLLQLVSRAAPKLLYPYFNSLADMLAHTDSILREEVNLMLRRLERVDCFSKAAYLGLDGGLDNSAIGLAPFRS